MTDLDRLQAAIERAVPGAVVGVYPEGTGVYRKYSGEELCATGSIRGDDAHLVIHGGLDTSGLYRRGNPKIGGCGDTAFILKDDGGVEVKIDTNWHNATVNWELIQNYYQFIGAEKRAKSLGCSIEVQVDEKTGKITGKIVQDRPTASRTATRRATVRPRVVRTVRT
jgi:hypothetical protein